MNDCPVCKSANTFYHIGMMRCLDCGKKFKRTPAVLRPSITDYQLREQYLMRENSILLEALQRISCNDPEATPQAIALTALSRLTALKGE